MSFRPQRLAEQIHHVLSEILLGGVKDPSLLSVTFAGVEVTRDLQLARVYYTVLGDENDQKEAQVGLKRATPFLRRAIGDELQVRKVPDLRFIYDGSQAQGRRIDELLRQAREMENNDSEDSSDD